MSNVAPESLYMDRQTHIPRFRLDPRLPVFSSLCCAAIQLRIPGQLCLMNEHV
jgi:hypothetical protein